MPAADSDTFTNYDAWISIFAVVVLYKTTPLESASVMSLLAAARQINLGNIRLHIRVADNSPVQKSSLSPLDGVELLSYPANPGLAEPYNDALTAAEAGGYDWLLTLDQDTHLPTEFLSSMAAEARKHAGNSMVAAVVPHMIDGERLISPMCFRGGFLPVVLPQGMLGLAPRHASAINSGSMLRCNALRSVDGYDPEFPLHNSDTRLYQKLDETNYCVAIADVAVPHELSILARAQRIRPERYRKMLEDESVFWDRHMSAAARAERLLRLAVRLVKSTISKEDPAFRQITQDELRRRLLTSHRIRLENLEKRKG